MLLSEAEALFGDFEFDNALLNGDAAAASVLTASTGIPACVSASWPVYATITLDLGC